MLVRSSLVIALLRILLWNVDCMFCPDCKVFVLKALGNFEEYQKAFATNFTHGVLKEVNYVLWQAKV